MWILKNSKDLLEYIQSRFLTSCNSIKIVDFSTIYITFPHSKLKYRLRELVGPTVFHKKKNDQRRYKYRVLGLDRSNFVNNKTTLILPKSSLKLISSSCSRFLWQHICFVWWTCFSTDSRHTYGYKLCFSSHWLVPLFLWGRLHTETSEEKRKTASPIL
jgi:hypothetical protein